MKESTKNKIFDNKLRDLFNNDIMEATKRGDDMLDFVASLGSDIYNQIDEAYNNDVLESLRLEKGDTHCFWDVTQNYQGRAFLFWVITGCDVGVEFYKNIVEHSEFNFCPFCGKPIIFS